MEIRGTSNCAIHSASQPARVEFGDPVPREATGEDGFPVARRLKIIMQMLAEYDFTVGCPTKTAWRTLSVAVSALTQL